MFIFIPNLAMRTPRFLLISCTSMKNIVWTSQSAHTALSEGGLVGRTLLSWCRGLGMVLALPVETFHSGNQIPVYCPREGVGRDSSWFIQGLERGVDFSSLMLPSVVPESSPIVELI